MLLWLESLISIRNFVLLGIFIVLFVVKIYPFAKYTLITYDKYYFGYINERVPRLALTTSQKKYFGETGIPYKTIQDLHFEKAEHQVRKQLGIEHPWELEFKNQTGFIEDVQRAASHINRRYLQATLKNTSGDNNPELPFAEYLDEKKR